MGRLGEVFSAPHNWCDRRCERCPLAVDCAVLRRERQRRWVAEASGRDPDDPDVWMEDAAADCERMLAELRAVAAAEGIDLEAPLPPRPIVLDAERLRRAAFALVSAVAAEPAEAPLTAVMLSGAKAVRIAGYLGDGAPHEAWASDAVPNLLLIDRLRAEILPAALDEARPFGRRLAAMSRLLAPFIAALEEPRRVLARLVERGAAPSPFCVIEPPPELDDAGRAD
ncbi:MAG: hypothetical protein HY908_25505 [Myxococcales bacterium]|nr:hypothetical protein [Myxococcales bacterium]